MNTFILWPKGHSLTVKFEIFIGIIVSTESIRYLQKNIYD